MAQRAAAAQVSYEDLYRRWEKGNWRSSEIDFSEDREHWHNTFSDLERRAALWNYAMFFHGEDAVADNLSPYIDAAPREEQKYFLATQQVDEARHAVFFGRFMREVVERGEDIQSSLDATRPELSWGFRRVFARLDKMADELRKDRSRPKLAAAVILYHFVIEASLAQPGQHFIESYLTERNLLPGFAAGIRNVSLDEQRHIGFGVKLVADLVEEDPECRDAIAELLREVTPYAAAVFVPPNWDTRYVECFGSTLDEVFVDGIESLDSKLRAAGLPPEELPGGVPLGNDLAPVERAERGLTLLRANFLGEKNGPLSHDPRQIELYFDTVRRSLMRQVEGSGPLTLQWEFADADPWFIRIDNGESGAVRGRADAPDIVLRCRFDDWVDITAGRVDARRLLLTRKLRPKARLRTLWRTRQLLGP